MAGDSNQQAKDFAAGYKSGKSAAERIAVGKLFRGAMGYADHHAGSTEACRESMAWKGALKGYLDGLPPDTKTRGVTVDANGIITKIG